MANLILPVSFQGKRILVTGGGRGLGRALVEAIIQNQGTVVALSKTKEKLDELKAKHPSVTTVCCDLMNWDETRKKVAEIGDIDKLVNNAGMNIPGEMMKISPEDFDRTMNCNVLSAINVTQVVAQNMIDRKVGGSIVNISSIAQKTPIFKQGLYGVSKSALALTSANFAKELGQFDIRVNCVSPGLFPSDMSKKALANPKSHMVKNVKGQTPLGRIATVEEMINVTLFLLSDVSSYVTGQSIFVCGGLTHS